MISANEYRIILQYGCFDGDQCYEARVEEFPDLVEYADGVDEVYALMADAIETTIAVLKEKGKSIPSPNKNTDQEYSGRVTLRMPKLMHKKLSYAAKKENISLNQFLLSLVSYGFGLVEEKEILDSTSIYSTIGVLDSVNSTRGKLLRFDTESDDEKKLFIYSPTASNWLNTLSMQNYYITKNSVTYQSKSNYSIHIETIESAPKNIRGLFEDSNSTS